jgi:ABC-type lipoprotein export system ATPase subunit
MLKVTDLTKEYAGVRGGERVKILSGVNLELGAGETMAVVGPSGSGKSTLLNIIGALDFADSGTVEAFGETVTGMDTGARARYRNRTVGIVFQLHHLLAHCNILENVLVPTLATPEAGRDAAALAKRAKELLGAVGLSHRLNHRPSELSGGERQRASVARALIHEPRLLLADEPTGSLDRTNAGRMVDLFSELNKSHGITVLMVTHSLELAHRMARVAELKDGTLAPTST